MYNEEKHRMCNANVANDLAAPEIKNMHIRKKEKKRIYIKETNISITFQFNWNIGGVDGDLKKNYLDVKSLEDFERLCMNFIIFVTNIQQKY